MIKRLNKAGIRQGFLYYLLATLALALIFFCYIFQGASTEMMTPIGWIYFVASCITHAAILLLIPFLLIQLPLAVLGCRQRWANGALGFVYGLLFVLAVANSYVYAIYHFHINGLVLEMLTGPGASEIFVFSFWIYAKAIVLSLLLMALSGVLAWLSRKLAKRCRQRHFWRNSLLPLLAVGLFSQAGHIYGSATVNASIVESTDVIPYYFPLRANKLLVKMGMIDRRKMNRLHFKSAGSSVVYPLRPLKIRKPEKPLNVVILCIDSWNPRTLTADCTPNICNFAREAEQYPHHLSSSNGTRGGIFGMFTGLSAYYWKSFEYANIQPLLIEQLLKAGYKVQAYPSATFDYPPFAKMIFGHVKGLNTNTPGATPYERDIRITHNFMTDLDLSSRSCSTIRPTPSRFPRASSTGSGPVGNTATT